MLFSFDWRRRRSRRTSCFSKVPRSGFSQTVTISPILRAL